MNLLVLADWARTHAYPLAVLAVLGLVLAFVLRAVRRSARRTPAAVLAAGVGAVLCTAYSGDTSWRFARDHLGMSSVGERGVMFAAAELALFSMALMARQNLRGPGGAPGTPGVLVWVITAVQVIPAYSETGIVGGTVRAFVGPVLAALLWHQAMGIELRHHSGAASQSLPAVVARELRERVLSRLGLSRRGRDAVQISRDRWTGIATRRAAVLADLEAGDGARAGRLARARRRLAVAVDRTDAAVVPEQRAVLLDRIAAYRNAASLASITLTAPWEQLPEPAPARVEIERVPEAKEQPEYARPALPRAVPAAVPRGARLLPIVARPVPAGAVPAAGRTRPEVRAEYVPEHEAVDDSPPPPAEDSLTARARADFLADLVDGNLPTFTALKARYRIGQVRAERIRAELKAKGLA